MTVCVSGPEVLDASLVSPPYVAVRVWPATERVVVLNVATPAVRVPVPRVLVPSLKVTVPEAVDDNRPP